MYCEWLGRIVLLIAHDKLYRSGLYYRCWSSQSPNFKLLRSPEIYSKESIPPAYVARARICKTFKELRNRFLGSQPM
jgi:hypothetical protein